MTDITFDDRVQAVFGADSDSLTDIERRARELFGPGAVVWECDAESLGFSHVSANALAVLGHPPERWVAAKNYWTDIVLHPDDRAASIAFCALATLKKKDHVFEYRTRSADGRVLWVRDYVKVLLGSRGVAQRLRGLMLDVTAEKAAGDEIKLMWPSRAELELS